MPVAPVISRSAQEEAVRQLEFIIAYPNIGVKIIIKRLFVYSLSSIFWQEMYARFSHVW